MSSTFHRIATHPFAGSRRLPGALLLLLCAGCGPSSSSEAEGMAVQAVTIRKGPFDVGTPLTHGVEVAREVVGSLVVLVEKDTVRFRAMHVPSGWTKIHLLFTTPDSAVNVALTDNGASLIVHTQTATECSGSYFYHQYGRSEHVNRHLYTAMADALGTILESCPRRTEAWDQYRRQFKRAEADFPAAMRVMMAHVYASRRGLVRCETTSDPDAWQWIAERCNF
jgi:hypothetical protein